MSSQTATGRSLIVAYAAGVGLAFVPLVGIPLRYMFQGLPPLLVYAGAFLLGLLIGVLFSAYRGGGRNR